jgi:riboflavin synthase alpha subunit
MSGSSITLGQIRDLEAQIKILAVEKANWQTLAMERAVLIDALNDEIDALRKRLKHILKGEQQ